MADKKPLQEANGQMILVTTPDMADSYFTEEEAKHGRYTTERLKARRPEIYQLCVSMLAEGVSKRQIQRALNLHHYTILAVQSDAPGLIEAEKKRIGRLARGAMGMCVDAIIDAVNKAQEDNPRGISLGDAQRLAVVFGILGEKSELLLGGATARVERVTEDMAEARQALYDLPDGPVIEAEYADITGFDAAAPSAKRAGSAVPGEDFGDTVVTPSEESSNPQSEADNTPSSDV